MLLNLLDDHEINLSDKFEDQNVLKNYNNFSTSKGIMLQGDCIEIMRKMKKNTIKTIFADPPFNLNKNYGKKVDDNKSEEEYLAWTYNWLKLSVPLLQENGSFFVYNLPKWNIHTALFLKELGLVFRNWIAISSKTVLPMTNRLYPCHYSLLYFTKGAVKTFHKIRTPIEVCRHCGKEIKDYGGYRAKMNPYGVSLTDIWNDIPPVRHKKFKSPERKENQLSTKILERVIEMSTNKNDLVLDPFGGGGTTFVVCEYKDRNWIGIELEDILPIKMRFINGIERHKNDDYVEL